MDRQQHVATSHDSYATAVLDGKKKVSRPENLRPLSRVKKNRRPAMPRPVSRQSMPDIATDPHAAALAFEENPFACQYQRSQAKRFWRMASLGYVPPGVK